jgi:hypothetical protein
MTVTSPPSRVWVPFRAPSRVLSRIIHSGMSDVFFGPVQRPPPNLVRGVGAGAGALLTVGIVGGVGLVEGTVSIGFLVFLCFLSIPTVPFPDTGGGVCDVGVEGGIVMSCT